MSTGVAIDIGLGIRLQESAETVRPILPVLIVAILKPNQGTVNVLVTWSGSEAKSWISTNATVTQSKLGDALVQGLIEDQ